MIDIESMIKALRLPWLKRILNNTLFFYKNLFYKNVEAEIYKNFKNMLRTHPRLRVRKRLYFAHLG